MLTLEQIPMRKDNYSYALIKDNTVIMIDPSEPLLSQQYFVERPQLKLIAILNTHSHLDHVAGNEVLARQWGAPVYGPAPEQSRIPALTHAVFDHDVIDIFNLRITAHDVRAHTIGHTAYHVHTPIDQVIKHAHGREAIVAPALNGHKVMFVGDSLFAAGCGRLFEGTTQNLFACLSFYLEQDRELLMACAHEYTKDNLAFARALFPNDAAIEERWSTIDSLLSREGASVPCSFGLEHDTNPFLLALRDPYLSLMAQKFGIDSHNPVEVIGALRAAKDVFKS